MRYIKPFNEAEQPLADWADRNPRPARPANQQPAVDQTKVRLHQWLENDCPVGELDQMVEDGIDLNYDNCMSLRFACRAGKIDVSKYFIDNDLIGDEYIVKNMPMCWAAEHGQYKLIDFLLKNGFNEHIERPMMWLQHSRKLKQSEKLKLIDYLQSKVDSKEASASPQNIQWIQDNVNVPAGAKLPGDYYKKKIRPDRES